MKTNVWCKQSKKSFKIKKPIFYEEDIKFLKENIGIFAVLAIDILCGFVILGIYASRLFGYFF